MTTKPHFSWALVVGFTCGFLAITTFGCCILWWFFDTAGELFTLGRHEPSLTCIAFSPDGRFLASGSHRTVKIWDVQERRLQTIIDDLPDSVNCLAFSPNGKDFAIASGYETHVFSEGARRFTIPPDNEARPVITVAFAPNGKTVAAASRDGKVRFWNCETVEEQAVIAEPKGSFWSSGGRNLMSYAPDGNFVVVPRRHTAEVRELPTGDKKKSLKGDKTEIISVAYAPNGKQIATLDEEGTAILWDLDAEKILFIFSCPKQRSGRGLRFSPDGAVLAVATNSAKFDVAGMFLQRLRVRGQLTFWDVLGGNEITSYQAHRGGISCLTFSPDGTTVATGGNDQTIKIWPAPVVPRHVR
jgi:WD40 repeat protein